MKKDSSVSSPISTSGAGYTYEHHVGAMFLSLLLIRGLPVVFKDCQVDEVSFQTEHLGWETDDLLVSCRSELYNNRQLAVQAKRSFNVSEVDSDCKKTFAGFWMDFNARDRFNPARDALLLVTLRGTQTLLNGLGGLLDCARNSSNEEDFKNRISLPGYLTQKARDYSRVIKSIIEPLEPGNAISDQDFWRFLKVIHILPLDFTTSTAYHETWTKQALALASTDENSMPTAESTWLELLKTAEESAAGAKVWRYTDLPEAMRNRHSPVESPKGKLQNLLDRSEITQEAIRTTIADKVSLPRRGPVTQVIEALAGTEVVVVTGPAGSGKSALAKTIVREYAQSHTCFSFRAEEFARSHIDDVLDSAITGKDIEALLGSQERVLMHVESLERLLEHGTRDAFTDLVGIVERCHNVRLLLTCREHSLETVVNSFFGIREQKPIVVRLPPLRDEELDEVEAALPQLSAPLADPELRKLLRSPYFLEMGTRIDWTSGTAVPSGLTAFRQRCWNEVVRRNSHSVANLPTRREEALVDVALRRARELRAFVPTDGIDTTALEELRRDDLVDKDPYGLVSPVHDVIEDWAIIRWIETRLETHEWHPQRVSEEVGGYPALRRGFREWIKEALNSKVKKADEFVLSAYRDTSLESHFRDDVLNSMLLSESSRAFVFRQKRQLLANDGELLIKLIHLMRVACMSLPPWLDGGDQFISFQLRPQGEAWPAVLEFVAENIDHLLPDQVGVLIGLLEDWARGSQDPAQQDGADAAGAIAFTLLEHLDGYSHQDLRIRVLRVVAKAPRANKAGFSKLIGRASTETNRKDPVMRDFVEILLCEMDGIAACRDFPKQMANLTLSQFLMSDTDLQRAKESPFRSPIPDSRMDFGLRTVGKFDYGNPSAFKGPFLPLLHRHPITGVELILKLVNHAGDWYGQRKWPMTTREPASLIVISIAGQGEFKQWFDESLWTAYRGISNVPTVIQCALMALESWLLKIEDKETLGRWLSHILKSSNNVMTTSVVASICMAYPRKGGEAALSILGSRQLVQVDLLRVAKERDARRTTAINFGPMSELFRDERIQSNALGHRQHNLETLAIQLQLGEESGDMQRILDIHLSKVPSEAERDLADRRWFLALHRMDIRKSEFVRLPSDSKKGEDQDDSQEKIALVPDLQKMDSDLRQLVEQSNADMQEVNEVSALHSWTAKQWDYGPDPEDQDFWKKAVSQVRGELPDAEFARLILHEVPQRVAALCIRDHWEDLDGPTQEWCVKTLADEILRTSNDADWIDPIPGNPFVGNIMLANGFAAYVLPKVVASDPDNSVAYEGLANAITHTSEQVIFNASQGIAEYLKVSNPDSMLQCAAAISMRASLLNESAGPWNVPKTEPCVSQRDHRSILGKLWHICLGLFSFLHGRVEESTPDQPSTSALVRTQFLEGSIGTESELTKLDLDSWHGIVSLRSILEILAGVPNSRLSREFFKRVAYSIVNASSLDEDDTRSLRRDHDTMASLAKFVLFVPAKDAMLCCQPLLDAIDERPDEVADFVEALVLAMDQAHPKATCFWDIWTKLATRTLNTEWLNKVISTRSKGVKLINSILLNRHWRDDIRYWRGLDGHEEEVCELVPSLPATAPILESYLRYLYRIGERSLPKSFAVVEAILRDAEQPIALLDSENTIFLLEMLLQRYVYAEPQRLKADPSLRMAVLFILDELVDAGSSVAYRMREDFVTPADS